MSYLFDKTIGSSITIFLFFENRAHSVASGVGISMDSDIVAPAKIEFEV